jgi:hypothetical protein
MPKISERSLVFEDFVDKVGDVFAVGEPGLPSIPLTLNEAQALPTRYGLPNTRPPFSLMFLGTDPRVLPQKLYRLEHSEMGVVTLFLVPIAKDALGVTYQSTFN